MLTMDEYEKRQKRKRWMMILKNPLLWWYRDRIIRECYDYITHVNANNYSLKPNAQEKCDIENAYCDSVADEMVYDLATDNLRTKWLNMKGWRSVVGKYRRESLELRQFGPEKCSFKIDGHNAFPISVERTDKGLRVKTDSAPLYVYCNSSTEIDVYIMGGGSDEG